MHKSYGLAICSLLVFTTPILAAPTTPSRLSTGIAIQGYHLRSGDQIHVEVADFPDITRDQTVLSDGTINVLYIGAVKAAGKTPEQLSDELVSRFSGIVRHPVISVSVLTTRPLRVNVIGEVLRPGPQTFKPQNQINNTQGSQGNPIPETVSGAISLAGGVTPLADLRQITVVRQGNDGPVETQINLWNALQSGDFSRDLSLSDGDTIKITKLADGDLAAEQMAQVVATTTLAPQTVQVQVAGEVKKAGTVSVDPRSTLLSAIYEAGGPTTEADLSRVVVARLTPSGKLDRKDVDLAAVTDGRIAFQVRSGDVVFVGRNSARQFADDTRAFLGPVGSLLNLIFPLGYLFGR
jgi:polysaccharide biosynthesis/export protein